GVYAKSLRAAPAPPPRPLPRRLRARSRAASAPAPAPPPRPRPRRLRARARLRARPDRRTAAPLEGRRGGERRADPGDYGIRSLEQFAPREVDHLVPRVSQQPVPADLVPGAFGILVLRHAVRLRDRP